MMLARAAICGAADGLPGLAFGWSSLTLCERARVAEWQTRWLQVPVSERAWGFKSPLAHKLSCLCRTQETPGPSGSGVSPCPGGGEVRWRTPDPAAVKAKVAV